jgi:hypothetical protein
LLDFLRRKALAELQLRTVTVPCFSVGIKTVVVTVAVEMRKSRAHDGAEAVAPVHSKSFGLRIERINHKETPATSLHEKNHAQGVRVLHRRSKVFCAGFQHRKKKRGSPLRQCRFTRKKKPRNCRGFENAIR